MSAESKLQSDIKRYLKSKGCYVLVIRPQPGIPDGMTDILFLCEGFWGALEVKDSPTAKYQPLQKETIEKFNDWSWAKRVDPISWLDIKQELESML